MPGNAQTLGTAPCKMITFKRGNFRQKKFLPRAIEHISMKVHITMQELLGLNFYLFVC